MAKTMYTFILRGEYSKTNAIREIKADSIASAKRKASRISYGKGGRWRLLNGHTLGKLTNKGMIYLLIPSEIRNIER